MRFLEFTSRTSRSLVAAFSRSKVTFILCISLVGLGSAANSPSGISILVAHFPPGPKRSKAFGIVGAGQPIGFIMGLFLGA